MSDQHRLSQNKTSVKAPKSSVFFFISILLTIAILTWLFTKISFYEVLDLILNADRSALILFIALSLFTSLMRLWRYAVILASNGYHPPRLPLFLIVLVRNLCSDLLPARTGTLAYIFLVTTRLGIPIGPATSSFALAFLFDIMAMAPLILISTLFISDFSSISPVILSISAVFLALSAYVVVIMLPRVCSTIEKLFETTKNLPNGLKLSLINVLDTTKAAIEESRRKGILLKVLAISVAVRLGKYASLYTLLYALLLPRGYSFSTLPIGKVFIGLTASELAASLPISGIAGMGAYQGAWILTFELLGVLPDMAKVTSASHHLFTQVYGYSLGLLALLLLMLPIFRRDR